MSKADEALANVRRWLCDNLNDGDAGKACSMLSAVSRHVNELEGENAKLREYIRMLAKATVYDPCEWCQYDDDGTCDTETEPMRDGCRLYAELRLMGVEVDQWPI